MEEPAEPVRLQTVKELYGIGYCRRRDLAGYERRNGRDTFKEEVALLARGRIGVDCDDERGCDTRWVRLAELVENDNIEDDDLDAALNEFFDALKADIKGMVDDLRAERS